MFDFDAGKLMIIAAVALVVIGPKDLPGVLRQLGQMVTRVKRMAGEFQNQFMDAMKEADIQDLRKEVAKLKDTATLDVDFDPAREIKTHLDEAMTPRAGKSFGSTSETASYRLPAPSAIGPDLSVASTGVGPVADLAALAEEAPVVEAAPDPAAGEVAPGTRRKAVVVRRRTASRFDAAAPGGGPAPPRSRNILPARRETPRS